MRPQEMQQTDAQGRFYAEATPIARSSAGTVSITDSAAIERWVPDSCRRDTVAYIPRPAGGRRVIGPGLVVGVPPEAFSPSVQWSVAGDGLIAVIHPEPYHVTFFDTDGAQRVGPVIASERVRLVDGHKVLWREVAGRPQLTASRERGRTEMQWGYRVMRVPDPPSWPRFLPPFLDDAARFAPDGTLWVQRSTAPDAPPTFDVIDRQGRLVRKVHLPHNRRLLGFGNDGVLYVAHVTDEGLEILERYRDVRAH